MTRKERVEYLLARPIKELTAEEHREIIGLTIADLLKLEVLQPVGRSFYDRLMNGIRVR